MILLYSAYKLAFQEETEVDPEKSVVLRAVRRIVPSTDKLDGQKLFTRINGRRLATPLFAVLLLIEVTDVLIDAGFEDPTTLAGGVVPISTTPPPAMSCFMPCDLAPGLSLP